MVRIREKLVSRWVKAQRGGTVAKKD